MKLKSNIGVYIDKSGYKKKFIAEKVGISSKQLSNWIAGRSYPTVDKLFKLAKMLDCTVDELYSDESKDK